MAERPDENGDVGLVLAGGGARGAYELGALSVLLPALGEEDLPRVLVGTSAGAINTAWLAANAHRLQQSPGPVLAEGVEIWSQMEWGTALESLLSWSEAGIAVNSVLDLVGVPGFVGKKLLDPSPLRETLLEGPLSSRLETGIDFSEIHRNVHERRCLAAAAVVATRAATSLSVVFHDSVRPEPDYDRLRGIAYPPTELRVDHVMASAAIPTVFPAVPVADEKRPDIDGWYWDGGTRLNTPIKPALKLGADRVIIVALNSPYLGDTGNGTPKYGSGDKGPAAIDGAASVIQSVLIDPLVNDLHTLTRTNEDLKRLAPRSSSVPADEKEPKRKVVPYILIAPPRADTIGEIATEVFKEEYPRMLSLKGLRRLGHPGNVGFVGSRIDAGDDRSRGELLSYLFFHPAFARRLIERGMEDAQDWIDRHPGDIWETERLA